MAKKRRLERLRIKYGNFTNHLRFSLRCLRSDLLPKDLRLRCKVKTSRSRDIIKRAERLLLKERIYVNTITRDKIKFEADKLEVEVKEKVTDDEFEIISLIHKRTYEKEFNKTKKDS